jgi:hypothetical protein
MATGEDKFPESEVLYRKTVSRDAGFPACREECMDDQASRNDGIPWEMVPVDSVVGLEVKDTLPCIFFYFIDGSVMFPVT